jgi:hypothetical protein
MTLDLISYNKAKAVDDRLTQALAAGNNPSGWSAAADAINAKLADQNKQTTAIKHGTQVINATMDTPLDIQIQGRTLVSLGQSNLLNGKTYLLADKKTKIRKDGSMGTPLAGVNKFTKVVGTTRTANLVGKIISSNVENPHSIKWTTVLTGLSVPSTGWSDESQGVINAVATLNGSTSAQTRSTNGQQAQALFSFDIVQEIERNIGRIPSNTMTGKLQWIKDNITSMTFNWYGYGTGPLGNKAYLGLWSTSGSWIAPWTSSTSSTIQKVSNVISTAAVQAGSYVDANGFVNIVAYADASDGVTASVVNTDYVELVITLSATAVLDTRPILIRTANYEGKITGSAVENPHSGKAANTNTTLPTVSGFGGVELPQNYYTGFATNDLGVLSTISGAITGQMGQHLFSFDIIQEVERQLGRIPKSLLADKVQWCKDNLSRLTVNWYGYGSGPSGNKATLTVYRTSTTDWQPNWNTNGTSSASLISGSISAGNFANFIDSNGLINYLAYADAAAPVANPTVAPTLSASGTGSGLAAGTYYVKYIWTIANVGTTLFSPEASITITAGQNITVTTPSLPFGVSYAEIFMGTASNSETYQGGASVSQTPMYTRTTALTTNSGTGPTTNTAVVKSTINTDYVELEIELKDSAVLYDPQVALYEVDATEYANILVTMDEATVLNKYPRVQGVQHIQNPYVIAEGENLLPSFNDSSITFWTPSPNSYTINSPYDITIVASNTWSIGVTYTSIYLKSGQPYTLSYEGTNKGIDVYRPDGSLLVNNGGAVPSGTVITPTSDGIHQIKIKNQFATETYNIKNPMLTLGSTAKPFTPRNPSYLFATTKLGQIGTVKDVLYKQDGTWLKRKFVEKDVILDGSLPWIFSVSEGNVKRFFVTGFAINSTQFYNGTSNADKILLTRFDGSRLKQGIGTNIEGWYVDGSNPFYINVPNSLTGLGDTYTPTSSEIQAYFYGWQAKTVDVNGKPTAWKSIGDGSDAPTQTLAYVSVNKAPNFTNYKISYQLATPVTQTITVEGDIALNGPTQVEVGSGVIVREKANPFKGGTNYLINSMTVGETTSALKNRVLSIVAVYKNGILDSSWKKEPTNPYGKERVLHDASLHDTTAEYTVTYLLLDRQLFTNNAQEVNATYDTSLKSVVDTLVERQSDLATVGSVNLQAIAELYKRVKALGG